MKITVIGYFGTYPKAGAATSGYLLEEGKTKVLIDCGSGVISSLQKYVDIKELTAVILTHYHADHTADIPILQYSAMMLTKLNEREHSLPIFALRDKENFKKLDYSPYCYGMEINPYENLIIGDINFSFIETKHSKRCIAIKAASNNKSIIYTGDTEYFDELAEFSKGSSVIISESSLYEDIEVPGHMKASEAGLLASNSKAQKLVLSHLPPYGNHEDLYKAASKVFENEIILAYSGLSILL